MQQLSATPSMRYFLCLTCRHVNEKQATAILPMQRFIACDHCGSEVDATLPKLREMRKNRGN